MKHSYLIIAHNEFGVLERLIQAIDDERNDIFIHFDKKLKEIPSFYPQNANLYVLDKRIDARWGHVSLIKAEYALFETAYLHGGYSYYHLLSGVHLPLKSQDYIHCFYERLKDKVVLTSVPNCEYQTNLKMHRYNFFMKNFMHQNRYVRQINQFLWKVCIRVQKELHIFKNQSNSYSIASEWVSMTTNSVEYILRIKKRVFKDYRFALGGDEFFVPSELAKSNLKDNIYFYNKLLKCDFGGTGPRTYQLDDFDELMNSDCLFARKFSHTDMCVVDKILTQITTNK